MADSINVMVVDDSQFMRELLSDIIKSSPGLAVNETARDGAEALRKMKRNRPDVVLLDLEMPNVDGLTFLEQVMKDDPIPVVVVSSYAGTGSNVVLDALDYGAVDFIPILIEGPKPDGLRRTLISKIQTAATVNPNRLSHQRILRNRVSTKAAIVENQSASRVVIIGSSTGGPRVVNDVLSELPADLPAGLLIVQHMPAGFTTNFAHRLNEISSLTVKEGEPGDRIKEGTALLAPGDKHMVVRPQGFVELSKGTRRLGARPSVNITMVTASEVFGAGTVGVLLSGMGQDGAFGMKMIKKRGGVTIAQDENSSAVYGMAKAADKLRAVDRLVPAGQIPHEIARAVSGDVGER